MEPHSFLEAQRDNVKIDESILGIKDLHVAAADSLTPCERFPVETPDTLSQQPPLAIFSFQPEKPAGRIVHVADQAFHVGNNYAFLDGIEDGLQKTSLVSKPEKVILYVLRSDPANSFDEFVKETSSHEKGTGTGYSGGRTSERESPCPGKPERMQLPPAFTPHSRSLTDSQTASS